MKREDAHKKVEVGSTSVQFNKMLFCFIGTKLFIFNYLKGYVNIWEFGLNK